MQFLLRERDGLIACADLRQLSLLIDAILDNLFLLHDPNMAACARFSILCFGRCYKLDGDFGNMRFDGLLFAILPRHPLRSAPVRVQDRQSQPVCKTVRWRCIPF